MIVHKGFKSLWYEITIRDAVLDDARGRQALQGEIVHDGNIVEWIGYEERKWPVSCSIGIVHLGSGLQQCVNKLREKRKKSYLPSSFTEASSGSPHNYSCKVLKR
jgi:hypothetical protein